MCYCKVLLQAKNIKFYGNGNIRCLDVNIRYFWKQQRIGVYIINYYTKIWIYKTFICYNTNKYLFPPFFEFIYGLNGKNNQREIEEENLFFIENNEILCNYELISTCTKWQIKNFPLKFKATMPIMIQIFALEKTMNKRCIIEHLSFVAIQRREPT